MNEDFWTIEAIVFALTMASSAKEGSGNMSMVSFIRDVPWFKPKEIILLRTFEHIKRVIHAYIVELQFKVKLG